MKDFAQMKEDARQFIHYEKDKSTRIATLTLDRPGKHNVTNMGMRQLYADYVSKAAVIHFSKCSAIDLAEYGIRVNCIAPGHIRTPLTAFTLPGMSEVQMQKIREALAPVWDVNQPLKRHGSPADVAQTVLFLASQRAAQITGTVMPIDGGITAGDPVNHLEELFAARMAALSPDA
jgi:NAD(P)-dependent dehydrogenase (short-subunit alcohol dehydrogenase family)